MKLFYFCHNFAISWMHTNKCSCQQLNKTKTIKNIKTIDDEWRRKTFTLSLSLFVWLMLLLPTATRYTLFTFNKFWKGQEFVMTKLIFHGISVLFLHAERMTKHTQFQLFRLSRLYNRIWAYLLIAAIRINSSFTFYEQNLLMFLRVLFSSSIFTVYCQLDSSYFAAYLGIYSKFLGKISLIAEHPFGFIPFVSLYFVTINAFKFILWKLNLSFSTEINGKRKKNNKSIKVCI